MTKADFYRKTLIESIIKDGVQKNNRVNVNLNKGKGYYTEIITLDEIREVTDNFKTHKTVESFLNELVNDRLSSIMETFNYRVNESVLDLNTTNCYDGYELNIPLINENYNHVYELFNEIDQDLGVEPQANPKVVNKASNTPLTKEPGKEKTPHIPIQAKQEKTQNPRKVDLILKSVFDSKFNDYTMKTDTGEWKVVKVLKNEAGKLLITWESKLQPSMIIELIVFPNDTNKITVSVKNRKGEEYLNTFFEIYQIPTDPFLAEKFFRKTLFSLLKKYIDSAVVQIDPFRSEYVFWKTDNPNFSYSFSTPNKNKIILDLISFISTAKKPILDDFFEQNNLKHKQGYLQTLLDSSEAAGIFQFKREGNEILIVRGPNYKAFLEGKVRRVTA
jgi:hypothetical protein